MFFLTISEGAYSDYNPTIYYHPTIEITDKVFQAKGREIGDYIIANLEDLENENDYFCKSDYFISLMDKWLQNELGYKPISRDTPEIALFYSDDMPFNK